jgi:hypothetical protein
VGRKIEVTSQHGDSDKSFGEDPRKKASIVKRGGRDVNSYSRFYDR